MQFINEFYYSPNYSYNINKNLDHCKIWSLYSNNYILQILYYDNIGIQVTVSSKKSYIYYYLGIFLILIIFIFISLYFIFTIFQFLIQLLVLILIIYILGNKFIIRSQTIYILFDIGIQVKTLYAFNSEIIPFIDKTRIKSILINEGITYTEIFNYICVIIDDQYSIFLPFIYFKLPIEHIIIIYNCLLKL
ncbi:phosphatidylinositol-glycan biosynthesis class H protein, putative [Cryptosporidium muris RN66]|uniref:Phosphatidylinositol-glycan biosynthesis class H protein, putative n=1 Tax=Cryptosporidium muris (strain RN66) TaxID=441375 RepID=B6AJE9_CRYMR|nr:phosphatidylinositol-glycan biosynthesis class H protein, putative [Cryptosporidium muris RN66]EEA08340.1 phosphatidylinositol-glycan biosynthesis class H protein, putative [Cryptosporidium muris RN66]|eukprot:XP_002142689.1 phosphatidylinositol-glycan biosynthesis class H protein [Cryptosporidium muris RN66]